MTAIIEEAIRIWQTVRPNDWEAELAKLPEKRIIHGVTWTGWRAGVREKLQIAWFNRHSPVCYRGMTNETRFKPVPDQSEAA